MCAVCYSDSPRSPPASYDLLEDMRLNSTFRIANLDLCSKPCFRDNLQLYNNICVESTGLHVTTSCFNVWRKNHGVNGHAKVIPAVRIGGPSDAEIGRPTRTFFFDDNVEFEGLE